MNNQPEDEQRTAAGKRRRWLLALDPIFEGGRQGKGARAWDVENELIAVALLGDVTIDLSQTRSAPAEIAIDAYAIFRDVDVLVAEGDHVELSGGVLRGDLRNDVPAVPEERRDRGPHGPGSRHGAHRRGASVGRVALSADAAALHRLGEPGG